MDSEDKARLAGAAGSVPVGEAAKAEAPKMPKVIDITKLSQRQVLEANLMQVQRLTAEVAGLKALTFQMAGVIEELMRQLNAVGEEKSVLVMPTRRN